MKLLLRRFLASLVFAFLLHAFYYHYNWFSTERKDWASLAFAILFTATGWTAGGYAMRFARGSWDKARSRRLASKA